MRVKIGNRWHDSDEEPVAIQVSTVEQQQIASMDRTVAPNGRYAVFPDSWSANRFAMKRWIAEDGEEVISANQELDEAHALLIWVLGITSEELETPILKERGDLERARKLPRRHLEEKYVLARMATRLSMRKVEDLEAEVKRLSHVNEFRKDRLRVEEGAANDFQRQRDDAVALVEKITGKPFRLHEALEAGEEARALRRQAEEVAQ